MIFQEKLLGVMGLFSRRPLDEQEFTWLGLFANHAAAAIANARAFEEVAERQKAEAEVRELASGLEAKIRRLVEANVVGIVLFNLEGAIREANDAFLQMVDYCREDLATGRVHWMEITPAEWRVRDEWAITELHAYLTAFIGTPLGHNAAALGSTTSAVSIVAESFPYSTRLMSTVSKEEQAKDRSQYSWVDLGFAG